MPVEQYRSSWTSCFFFVFVFFSHFFRTKLPLKIKLSWWIVALSQNISLFENLPAILQHSVFLKTTFRIKKSIRKRKQLLHCQIFIFQNKTKRVESGFLNETYFQGSKFIPLEADLYGLRIQLIILFSC